LANIPTGLCFDDEYKKADAELESFLQQIRGALSAPQDKARLDKAQEAWVKYRDLTCDAESRVYFGDGSGRLIEAATCMAAETRLQLKDLHEIYGWRVEWMRRQRE
jgi:uncharacterized protein YecT (DUF1311 family)